MTFPDAPMLALLLGGAAVAGWIDAVIGGGGLVLLPLLLIAFPGAGTALALGTNKLTAIWGTGTAAVLYARSVSVPKNIALLSIPLAFAGATAGALSASLIDSDVLRPIVIVLMIVAGIVVTARPEFGSGSGEPVGRARVLLAGMSFAVIGFYDGIFGPGTGMFLIITLTAILSRTFLESAALAKIANTATNAGALLVFGLQGHVFWALGALLAVANVAGSVLGTRLVLARGSSFVRYAVLAVVIVMSIKLTVDQFG